MIPGNVIGSSTNRLKIFLPGKLNRSSANAVGTPIIRQMITVAIATIALFHRAVKGLD